MKLVQSGGTVSVIAEHGDDPREICFMVKVAPKISDTRQANPNKRVIVVFDLRKETPRRRADSLGLGPKVAAHD